jgi:1-aminocyclopropane-1-carboxylate deaminase
MADHSIGLAFFNSQPYSPLQPIEDSYTKLAGVSFWLKRDDLIDPFISGNKFRKLKYNLIHACQMGYTRLVSIGGAHSNHLYSLSFAAKKFNLPFLALVRGEIHQLNSTTIQAIHENGHQIQAISRIRYREGNFDEFLKEGDYFIPEGGSNEFALKGVAEMLEEIELKFDQIAVPCGTGGTLSGLVKAGAPSIGIEVLKGNFIGSKVLEFTGKRLGYSIFAYPFGGYAKNAQDLQHFMDWFASVHKIQLEFVYSGKLLFGLYDLMSKGFFPKGSTLIGVHTGGLRTGLQIQGN